MRSRPLLFASVQVSSPVRFLGASPLGAPTTSGSTTRHLPQPHRPIEFFANNFFDCRHRGSLAASTQVNRAPRDLHPPSIFSPAHRGQNAFLERAAKKVFTSRSWVTSRTTSSGSRSSLHDRFLPTHLPRFRARCARSSSSPSFASRRSFLPAQHSRVTIQDNGSVSSVSCSALYFRSVV